LFAVVRREGACLVEAELLGDSWVCHAITTRHGGISPAPFDSLNMGLHTEDAPRNVLGNRKRVCAALNYSPQAWVSGEQVHGVGCHVVTAADAGRGAWAYRSSLPATDILITQTPGILLVSFYADCVPVLLADPVRRAVGMAHCGWQGTLAGAARFAVQAMSQAFGSAPSDLVAVLGPSIGPCCYEVSAQLARRFQEAFGADAVLGKQLDLRLANRRLLAKTGLSSAAIHTAPWCTSCQQDLFFSHRASGGRTGRMAALIGVR
jgi:YfiH family protein